ncbi:MAG TPA: hypothetical protein VFG35_22820, partial [Actinoplanes sp.]|nr:hypothetical protein [Actinoplanes sp.]
MRVFRTILGMLALTIGLPSLLAGVGLWAAMQHRDQGGAFSGELQRLSTPGYAVVVEDVDQLLRTDAPFTRLGDTQLRLLARTADGPAFIGLAPTGAVRQYLDGVAHSTVSSVDIGTGALPVATTSVNGQQTPRLKPDQVPFWTRTDRGAGQISWIPADVRGGPYSLVVMSRQAAAGLQVNATAELRPGWLNSSAWGLLTLGTLLIMIGMAVLAWLGRRREIVYVVEPSQVPDLMRAIGAPLPALPSTGRPVGAHRPRTLADPRPGPVPAVMAWPSTPTPALTAVAVSAWPAAGPGMPPDPSAYAAATAVPAVPVPAPAGPVPAPAVPVPAVPAPAVPVPVAAASASREREALSPGEPLQLIGAGSVSLPMGKASSEGGEQTPRRTEKAGKRRTPPPDDMPMFQSSAVDAWVAETAPARARETEAQATARMAEAARRHAAVDRDKPWASSPASPRTHVPAALTSSSPVDQAPADSVATESTTAAVASVAADSPVTAVGPVAADSLVTAVGPVAADSRAAVVDSTGAVEPVTAAAAPPTSPADSIDAVAAAYAAGTADARAVGGEIPEDNRDPRVADQQVSMVTGPRPTDWSAMGLPRTDSPRLGRQV